MQVCFLSLSCTLAPSHTHSRAHTPTPDFPKGVLSPSPPLPHPNPCKVVRGLICRDHLRAWDLKCRAKKGGKSHKPQRSPSSRARWAFCFSFSRSKSPDEGVSVGTPTWCFSSTVWCFWDMLAVTRGSSHPCGSQSWVALLPDPHHAGTGCSQPAPTLTKKPPFSTLFNLTPHRAWDLEAVCYSEAFARNWEMLYSPPPA